MADDDKPGLKDEIMAEVKKLLEGPPKDGGAAKPGAAGGDVTSQVEVAVAKVRAGDAEKSRQEKTEERLAALESQKTKAPEAEKQPKQYRRITNFLWGNDDDD